MKRFSVLLLLIVLLTACGGGHSSSSSTSTGSVTIPGPVEAKPTPVQRPSAQGVAKHCPKGAAVMGCATGATPQLHRGPGLAIPSVPLFSDVSEWQGAVGWSSVAAWQRSHGWHPMAVWKMGEFRLDSQARRNASETARLGFYRVGYWFVRNTGCASEAGQIISEARAEGLSTVVEDDEVPEARGYAACLTPRLHAAGLTVVEYTSPGSNPDAVNPGVQYLWVAAFGPQHPPCLWTCSVGELDRQTIVAWQLTDGVFGFVTNVPGIGRDDVSADYGFSRLLAPKPAPTKPAKPAAPAQLSVLLDSAFPSRWGQLNERVTGAQFLGAYAHREKYRGYLHGLLHDKLEFLAARIAYVAITEHRGWAGSARGSRFQFVIHDAQEAAAA